MHSKCPRVDRRFWETIWGQQDSILTQVGDRSGHVGHEAAKPVDGSNDHGVSKARIVGHRRQPGRAPLADPNSLSAMTRSKACLVAASATSRASRS